MFVNISSADYNHFTDIMSLGYTGKNKGKSKFSCFLYQETIPDSFGSFAFYKLISRISGCQCTSVYFLLGHVW